MVRRLEVYVGTHCLSQSTTLAIVEEARRLPGLEVIVIDIDQAVRAIPECVVAVPAYVLGGRLVALGNPAPSPFLASLRDGGEDVW